MEFPVDTKAIAIPGETIKQWQEAVNTLAEVLQVPVARVMKVSPPYLEVFCANSSNHHLYKAGQKELLASQYCERVISTRERLLVPNAHKDRNWGKNPDLARGMVSYLGFPLFWPNGEVFGTLCVLDSKENRYGNWSDRLLLQSKTLIEAHLAWLYLKRALEVKTTQLEESEQRLRRALTERPEAEAVMRQLAFHDAVTGLPNRWLFQDRLGMALAQARRAQHKLAVMLLDLDYFKNINDKWGHPIGDQLLKEMGQRLTGLLRQSDTVARLGGDEFVLLLPGITQEEDATKVAHKVLEVLRKPFALAGQELYITASLGVALYPEDGRDIDTLMRKADIAMYRAKAQGRNGSQRALPEANAKG